MVPAQAAAELVAPGKVLAGKYRVERILGAGGMGVVVAATHLELDQQVALKFLLPHFLEHAEAVQRFMREARAAVRIRSENVAHILDVGRLDDGAPYIVMEFLEGQDLATRLESGPLSVEEAVDAVIQASDAIGEAHLLGIIHRDLKPANLFLTHRADGSPLVKVLDFGISKVTTGLEQSQLTRTSGLMGSPFYMSPEQLTTPKDVDSRTDVWSLGIILYELLRGAPPFEAEAMGQLVLSIMSNPVPPIAPTREDVSTELDNVIATALAKERENRYQRVEDLAQALLPFSSFSERTSRAPRAVARPSAPPTRREGGTVAMSTPPPPPICAAQSAPPPPTARSTAPPGQDAAATVPRRLPPALLWFSLAVGVIGACTIIATWFIRWSSGTSTPPTSSALSSTGHLAAQAPQPRSVVASASLEPAANASSVATQLDPNGPPPGAPPVTPTAQAPAPPRIPNTSATGSATTARGTAPPPAVPPPPAAPPIPAAPAAEPPKNRLSIDLK